MKSHTVFKKVLLVGCILAATQAQASLVDLNNGLIYDTDSNLVWLQDANTDGAKNWDQAIQWASDFIYDDGFGNQYEGWSLPSLSQLDHLLSTELGGSAGSLLTETAPFYNFVTGGRYWTSTETVGDSQEHAWTISGKLAQGTQIKSEAAYAWAVRSGNGIVPVPVPGMVWPFSVLLAVLMGRRKLS